MDDGDGNAWDDEPADALAEEIVEVFDDIDDPEAAYAAMQRGEFEEAYAMMGLSAEQVERLIERWRERAETILTVTGPAGPVVRSTGVIRTPTGTRRREAGQGMGSRRISGLFDPGPPVVPT